MYFVRIRDGFTLMYHATQKMSSKAGIGPVVMIRVTKNTCPPTKSVQLEVGTGRRTVRRQLVQTNAGSSIGAREYNTKNILGPSVRLHPAVSPGLGCDVYASELPFSR
jgi:hypothetical protein